MAVSSASAHCYQTHWIAEDLALHYAPFAPHYVGLTPPQTPAVAAPWPRPYWGLGLVRSWQRSARWSALSRRQWPTPLVAKSPVVMGYCGVHSAECGAVWTGDLGRSANAALTARAQPPRGPATHVGQRGKSALHVPLGVLTCVASIDGLLW